MGDIMDFEIRSRLGEIGFFLDGSPGPHRKVMDLHGIFNEQRDEMRLLDELKQVIWEVEEYLKSPNLLSSHSEGEVRRVWVSVGYIRSRIEHNLR